VVCFLPAEGPGSLSANREQNGRFCSLADHSAIRLELDDRPDENAPHTRRLVAEATWCHDNL